MSEITIGGDWHQLPLFSREQLYHMIDYSKITVIPSLDTHDKSWKPKLNHIPYPNWAKQFMFDPGYHAYVEACKAEEKKYFAFVGGEQ